MEQDLKNSYRKDNFQLTAIFLIAVVLMILIARGLL